MSAVLPCPRCPEVIEVSEEDPDASLRDLWRHLGRHAFHAETRTPLFFEAQRNMREEAS